MSRMEAPIVALMSPYLPGQVLVSIALQSGAQHPGQGCKHSPTSSSQNP